MKPKFSTGDFEDRHPGTQRFINAILGGDLIPTVEHDRAMWLANAIRANEARYRGDISQARRALSHALYWQESMEERKA